MKSMLSAVVLALGMVSTVAVANSDLITRQGRVFGGNVTLCSGTDYSGTCVTDTEVVGADCRVTPGNLTVRSFKPNLSGATRYWCSLFDASYYCTGYHYPIAVDVDSSCDDFAAYPTLPSGFTLESYQCYGE